MPVLSTGTGLVLVPPVEDAGVFRPSTGMEVLDGPPPVMNRPLCLVDGRAYAATWLWMQDCARRGTQECVVIRDDGALFGGPMGRSLEALGFPVKLAPVDARLSWSWRGVQSFLGGEQPDPTLVFRRLVSLLDTFVSFERSLADHATMCELLACYVMSTWFQDVFPVIGYLWITGEWGAAKSKLATIIAETSYLGVVLEGGASFPTVRDAADRGASLIFDDCEHLTTLKGVHPSLRNLLLSGTRRGGSQQGVPAPCELYDPSTGSWSFTDDLKASRASQTATLLPSGEVMIAGGHSGSAALASAESYRLAK